MTRRFASRWPSRQHAWWRAPRTWRGRLIIVALASAALAVKLTIGLGLVLLLLHHLLH